MSVVVIITLLLNDNADCHLALNKSAESVNERSPQTFIEDVSKDHL